jgi:hypothetical protein
MTQTTVTESPSDSLRAVVRERRPARIEHGDLD